MAKIGADWDHTEQRLLERVRVEDRESVMRRIDALTDPLVKAPPEMVGHYEWHVDVNNGKGELVAQIICRGIWLRTVYGPLMDGGMGKPHSQSVRYRVDKNTKAVVKA